tara:strand:+ start:683 stop:1246 length:564 start_codon:yes stop_codon:yes gene_type:complete
MTNTSYIDLYLRETEEIIKSIDRESIGSFIECIDSLKERKGRLFICGVGGSSANASHAVNDFRKILGIESYAPSDNVSELTARVNDESWEDSYVNWLKISNVRAKDCVMVFSVGGGSEYTSKNLVKCMDYAKEKGATVVSIVSRDGGYAKKVSDACILVPIISDDRITPHAEGWQGILWHLVVSCIK